MRYPIAIEPGDERTAFGVVVPDLPGCFSAGDTIDEAIANAEDAVLLSLEDCAERGEPFPQPSELATVRERYRDLAASLWMLLSVDESKIAGPAERINITVPRRALARIDAAAMAANESRSAFLVNAALARANDAGVREQAANYKVGIANRRPARKRSAEKAARSKRSK